MPKVKLYNAEGKEVGEKDLRDDVFGLAVSPAFVHEVVIGLRANARKPWAHTKGRGDVRGGGKKPWRQKGTGRARHGSIRSPLWAGGGVTFGPDKERDYAKKINKKAKRKAFLMALSDKVADSQLLLVEGLTAKGGKTKEIVALIGKLPVKGSVTLVRHAKDDMLSRSVRNLKSVRLVSTDDMGLNDVLNAGFLLMTPEAATRIEEATPVAAEKPAKKTVAAKKSVKKAPAKKAKKAPAKKKTAPKKKAS